MIGDEDLSRLSSLNAFEMEQKRKKAVLENLRRIAQVAAIVNAVELRPEDEIGPEWKP